MKAQDYLRKYKDGDGLEAIEQVSTLLYLEKVVGIDMQLQEIDSRGRDSAKGSGEKKIKRKFFLGFLWKESFIMLLVIFFAGVLHVFMFYLTAFQGHFNMVLDH